jgi:hypothetical protein
MIERIRSDLSTFSCYCVVQLGLVFRHSSLIVPTLEPELRKAAVDSYDNALRAVFLADIGLALIGLLCCLPIQEFAFGLVEFTFHMSYEPEDTILLR